jgi:Skp family chaperone for outer membrane proteins
VTDRRSEEERARTSEELHQEELHQEELHQEELEQVMKRTDAQPIEYFAELLVARLVADAKVISASRGKNQKTYYQTLLSEVYKKLSQLSNTLPTDERIRGNTLLVEIKRVIKNFDTQEGAGVVRADSTDVMNLINGQENLLCIIYPSLTR